MKIIYIVFLNFFIACSAVKKNSGVAEMPSCLNAKMKSMDANPKEGSPKSVTRYTYNNQTVYYLVLPCCDKYNVVYDSACNILGYPDGGYTGRGDGKLADFKNEARDGKVIWKKE